jgi:L-asparaginase / beta-aspartyl-peptidase
MRRALAAVLAGWMMMSAAMAAEPAAKRWTLVIHGGAGTIERARITPAQDQAIRAALNAALKAGETVLAGGGDALDAVQAAVVVLEDDPNFNAGRGAVFTYDGVNEMDAAVMRGDTRAAGAVTGVTATKNPVKLARAVMEQSPHVFLSREGADQFSREQGLEQAGADWFATPERRRQLDELKSLQVGWYDVDLKYGTVGAVAVDQAGHVAAATSTGGLTGKRWGRIGDSPLIGAGTYADDRACAVSATGAGEFFIRVGVAAEICARMRLGGLPLQAAADSVMAEVKALGGSGGVIVVAPGGENGFSFNTPGMYRARTSSDGMREVAIYGDEGQNPPQP